jgi:hypothetical protein
VACGFDGAFLYGDIYTLPATMGVYQQGNPTVHGKGVVPIACPNCGHLMLFDTKTLPGVL